MLKRFYIWILERREAAEAEIRQERLADGLLNVIVLPREIQDRLRIPAWLLRRAERWQKRCKTYGV